MPCHVASTIPYALDISAASYLVLCRNDAKKVIVSDTESVVYIMWIMLYAGTPYAELFDQSRVGRALGQESLRYCKIFQHYRGESF